LLILSVPDLLQETKKNNRLLQRIDPGKNTFIGNKETGFCPS
jgi:hypothetical protein